MWYYILFNVIAFILVFITVEGFENGDVKFMPKEGDLMGRNPKDKE